jgi:DNA-binding response OmpR family regulator
MQGLAVSGTTHKRSVNSEPGTPSRSYGWGMSLADFSGRSVLVVDDEPMVREVVTAYLSREGFEVTEAGDGKTALSHLDRQSADLVVLDVMLPEADGYSVLAELRRRSNIPVILLTARGEEPDRVLGLELGADDYVVKPFSPRELAARVRTVLKRAMATPSAEGSSLDFDGLSIDPGTREVMVGSEPVEFTPKEFDLLYFLASSPRQVFSRTQLLEQVWDSNSEWQDPSTVTVHVRRVRRKIEATPDEPRRLITVWGVGYKFEP